MTENQGELDAFRKTGCVSWFTFTQETEPAAYHIMEGNWGINTVPDWLLLLPFILLLVIVFVSLQLNLFLKPQSINAPKQRRIRRGSRGAVERIWHYKVVCHANMLKSSLINYYDISPASLSRFWVKWKIKFTFH